MTVQGRKAERRGWSDNVIWSKINCRNKKRGWDGLKKEEGVGRREDQKGCRPLITAPQIMCGAISAQWRFPLGLIKYLYCLLSMSQCCPDLSYQCDKRLMRESEHRQWDVERQTGKKRKEGQVEKSYKWSLLFLSLVHIWFANCRPLSSIIGQLWWEREAVCVCVWTCVCAF